MANKTSAKKSNTERMKMIQSVAKELWKTGKYKKYSDVVKKASDQLKKDGKL